MTATGGSVCLWTGDGVRKKREGYLFQLLSSCPGTKNKYLPLIPLKVWVAASVFGQAMVALYYSSFIIRYSFLILVS